MKQLTAMLERTADGAMDVDQEGKIMLWNRAVEHVLGFRATDVLARFLMNIGSCRFAMLQYHPAMHAFIQARRLALRCGDMEAVAVASCNLSSLYLQLGDVDAGLRVAGD